MYLFDIIIRLITLCAIFNHVNLRYLHFPSAIVLVFSTVGLSLIWIAARLFASEIKGFTSSETRKS
jgi:hypothetical protein